MKQGKYLLLFVSLVFVLVSCKKELDLNPTDTFSEANSFITLSDVQLGANGAYGRYSAYENDIYFNALLSDEVKLGLDNAGQGALTYRYQFSADPTTGGDVVAAWGDYYGMIDQVNRVLPFIPTVTATPAEEPRRDIIKGQLLALRAIAHFGLLQAYSKNYDPAESLGISIMLTSDPLAKPARNTMAEVMTQIEADFAEARSLLPAVTAATFSDTVMNKVNIAAYQARIALYRKDYDAAITFASEVITANVKPLAGLTDFPQIWTDNNDFETLFRIRYATSTAIGGLWGTTAGQYYIAPSDKLFASYDASDIRRDIYIGDDGAGNHYVNKFYLSSRGGLIVDMKACRIAEMYLIRAEAYAKRSSPDIIAGALDLNLLRTNRITGYVDETFATSAVLADAVLQERFKELAFEGFRFYDLKRNNLPVQRLASDANPAWQTLVAGDFKFVLPIPRNDLQANPNLVQNAGY